MLNPIFLTKIYHYFCGWNIQIDTPMLPSEWKRRDLLSHFTVVRKLDGGIFPMGFAKEASEINSKAKANVLCSETRQVSVKFFVLWRNLYSILFNNISVLLETINSRVS